MMDVSYPNILYPIDKENFIGLVSTLAEATIKATLTAKGWEHTEIYHIGEMEHRFTEDAQEIFNKEYDKIEDIFNSWGIGGR